MSAPRSKIVKKDGAVPSAIETRVATELETIAANNAALKTDLKNLYISSAREIEVDGGRKAIVVVVPFPLLADFKKIQKLLVEELEKKLGGSTVLIIANRTLVSAGAWQRGSQTTGVRPRSRTLQHVQSALLDDIVYPSEITGKRLRVKTDGARLLKVHLSPKDAHALADRTDVFRAVYKTLTNKDISFEFLAQ